MASVVSIAPYRFLPPRNGGHRLIALFHRYFGRLSALTCITVRDNDNREADGFETVPLLSNTRLRYLNPLYFFSVRRLLREKQATHLLIEHPYFGWLGYLLKLFSGVRLIVHSHNIEGLRFKSMGKWWWGVLWNYERWTHRRADYNFFISEEDRQYAVQHFGLHRSRCLVVPYGVEQQAPPSVQEKQQAKEWIREQNGIGTGEAVLFFNGAFGYPPNRQALQVIEHSICPFLDRMPFSYRVIVCGTGMEDLEIRHPKMIAKGFVEAVEPYLLGTDVFLNPVLQGGGVKTKIVEALGQDCTVVSTRFGAAGIHPQWCNGKLLVVDDGQWEAFAQMVGVAATLQKQQSETFYTRFWWGHITQKAAQFISNKDHNTL